MSDGVGLVGVFLISIASCLLVVGSLFVLAGSSVQELVAKEGVLSDPYNLHHSISCDSDSMGLGINCGDEFYSRTIDPVEPLSAGEIYIFRDDDNESVIHRLVFRLDNGSLIFKGDNNEVGELVDRSQVYAKPLMMRYG